MAVRRRRLAGQHHLIGVEQGRADAGFSATFHRIDAHEDTPAGILGADQFRRRVKGRAHIGIFPMGVGVGGGIGLAAGVPVFATPAAAEVIGCHPLVEGLHIADIGERIAGLVHRFTCPEI